MEKQFEMPPLNLRDLIGSATRVAVLTGAGISADSGLPTLRGAGANVWKGMTATDSSSHLWMVKKDLVALWKLYDELRRQVATCSPNPGHLALAEMASHVPVFTLITQNIDGLHGEAGSPNVLELHGSLWRAKGVRCSHKQDLPPGPLELLPPNCAVCGHRLRPDVLFFGERISQVVYKKALAAVRRCQVLLVIGTSSEVLPASLLPLEAKLAGARVIEINPCETSMTEIAHESIRASGAQLRWIVGEPILEANQISNTVGSKKSTRGE